MPAALSMDLRTRVIADRQAGASVNELANRYHLDPTTIRRWWRRFQDTNNVTPRAIPGRPAKCAPYMDHLRSIVHQHPDATLAEIRDLMPVPVGVSTLHRALRKLGMTLKKSTLRN